MQGAATARRSTVVPCRIACVSCMCRGPPRVEALPVTLDREEEEEEAESSLSQELSTVYTDTLVRTRQRQQAARSAGLNFRRER